MYRTMWWTKGMIGVVMCAGLLVATGCGKNMKDENAALRNENSALQRQLDAERAARNSAGQPGTAAANTGFESIAGVDVSRGAHGEINVRVPGDVLFASGQSDLRSTSKQTLNQIASVLKSEYSSNIIRIEGYTDSDPITKSKWKDNLELSANRALAVHRYLQEQGVPSERMYAAGFGATNFVAPNSSAVGKAKNRRVEIVVVMN